MRIFVLLAVALLAGLLIGRGLTIDGQLPGCTPAPATSGR